MAKAADDERAVIESCIGVNDRWESPTELPVCPPKFGIKLPWRSAELKYKKDPDQRLTFLIRRVRRSSFLVLKNGRSSCLLI